MIVEGHFSVCHRANTYFIVDHITSPGCYSEETRKGSATRASGVKGSEALFLRNVVCGVKWGYKGGCKRGDRSVQQIFLFLPELQKTTSDLCSSLPTIIVSARLVCARIRLQGKPFSTVLRQKFTVIPRFTVTETLTMSRRRLFELCY